MAWYPIHSIQDAGSSPSKNGEPWNLKYQWRFGADSFRPRVRSSDVRWAVSIPLGIGYFESSHEGSPNSQIFFPKKMGGQFFRGDLP